MKRIVEIFLTCLTAVCISQAQGPWLGGQQEIAVGIRPVGITVLGLYVNRVVEKDLFGQPMNSTEIRLGWMGWSVKHEIYNSEECTVLESDAQTSVTVNIDRQATKKAGYFVRQWQKTYINSWGKIVKEQFRLDTPGFHEAEVVAIYKNDSIDITSVSQGKETKTTLFPPDMQLFHDRFKPMIKDGKVVLREKVFAVLDPATLGVKTVKASVATMFNGTVMQEKYQGNCIRIEYPDEVQKVFISSDDELVKVELPEDRYLLIEQTPPRKLEKILSGRKGG